MTGVQTCALPISLFALGIRFVGETVAKKLAFHFKNINSVMNASFEELIEVEDVGTRIANSIIEFFNNENNKIIIERLKSAGLKFEIEENNEKIVSDLLNGASIVISGTFVNYPRDEYKVLIEQNGGKNTSSITSKTNYILAGSNMGPSKLEKAKKLGVRILSEEEFLKMINK